MEKFIAIFIIIFLICALMYFGVAGLMRLCFPGEKAEIEQLRVDIENLKENVSEDVIGQAVEFNRLIANNRRYNQLWWSDIIIPDGWNKIEYIKIPKTT